MAYKLNNIDISTYGFIPGRMEGETLAVKGIFDLPKRLGDTHYDWAERNGVQPFVDADEIFLDGRSIYFQVIMQGELATLKSFLNAFKTAVDAFNDVVPFETPYGSFCVLVNKVTPKFYNGGALVLIEFFEPEVGASCSIGTTPTIYNSAAYSETAQKNNCESGYYGSTETLTAAAGKFTSTVSQAAADLLAVQWVRDYKQDYANATGTCIINPPIWYNVKLTGSLQKNDCGSGYIGSEVTYTVAAYKYSSLISQADADAKAQADLSSVLTQSYANSNGTCILFFYSNPITFTRQKNDCAPGYTGSTLSLTVPAGMFTSLISQADADSKALAYAELEITQTLANEEGTCTLSTPPVSFVSNARGGVNMDKRIMKWRLNEPIVSGTVYYFLAYGVVVSYTATGSDTAATVASGLIDEINGLSIEDWNVNNQYPIYFAGNARPIATWDGVNIIVTIDYFKDPYFNLYT